jgi:hypothetical protein
MNVGTNDKKKVGFLIALALVAGYMVYTNLFSGPSYPTAAVAPAAGGRAAGLAPDADTERASTPAASGPDIRRANRNAKPKSEEFHPALRSKRKEDQIDVWTIDPTLRWDLLAKVQDVKPDGGQRNLFQFGPIQPVVKLDDKEPVVKIAGTHLMGPMPVTPKTEVTQVDQPPPIPYKYYGLSTTHVDGKRTAFFLDGEDIILAPEGYVVKKRYKVVRITATSVVMEDIESKRQQTLTYTEEVGPNASGG